jgi:hypothetical protein
MAAFFLIKGISAYINLLSSVLMVHILVPYVICLTVLYEFEFSGLETYDGLNNIVCI